MPFRQIFLKFSFKKTKLYLVITTCLMVVINCIFIPVIAIDNTLNGLLGMRYPKRIVVMPLYAEEILFGLVDVTRVVFVGHVYRENSKAYSMTMELTRNIRGCNDLEISVDDFIDLNPDLIILERANFYYYEYLIPDLVLNDIPILWVDAPRNLDDITELINILGVAVGEQEKAAQMTQEFLSCLSSISYIVSLIPDNERKTVSYLEYRQGMFNIIAQAARVINLGYDKDEDGVSLMNDLAKSNPSILYIDPYLLDSDGTLLQIGDNYTDARIKVISGDKDLQEIEAVKNHQIYVLPIYESQYIVESIMELVNTAYPGVLSNQVRNFGLRPMMSRCPAAE